ncbi:uncharacterized protein PHALS_07677 [Plasmopara halstedii]|uniref:Uncharacterized protein n=1 Tax=Plasmopara halstedii TaxID=4781 RepID=A0A0P1B539_PLAHL|nr:uncharacterized protein PHALS_07677 [Plasmopara halstedii]CEG49942.1 hypothetical protein PHALS_07677 [Plasmopara halstedii]|eukprot:XP_024586311.1 hypothetical protein PHALS_07677 [Plasmopara halstedii]
MEVDTPSATEPEEMEVEDSMTNADIRSLMLIAGGSEDRSYAPFDTQARGLTITLPASTRSTNHMVSSSNAVNAFALTDSNSIKLDC